MTIMEMPDISEPNVGIWVSDIEKKLDSFHDYFTFVEDSKGINDDPKRLFLVSFDSLTRPQLTSIIPSRPYAVACELEKSKEVIYLGAALPSENSFNYYLTKLDYSKNSPDVPGFATSLDSGVLGYGLYIFCGKKQVYDTKRGFDF